MKSLKVSFAFSLLLSFVAMLNSCATQKNIKVSSPLLTIEYANNPKTHSRAIFATEKELIIAASDGKVYFYPKESKNIYSMFSTPEKEYRDIIFNENKIVIVAVGDSSEVTSYKLEKSDKLFKTPFDGVFLNGIDYSGNTIFMMGDPVNNKFSLFKSLNWGETWESIKNSPFAFDGEAGFAASGTNVKMLGPSIFTFVSGGDSSRYFRSNNAGESWFSNSMGYSSCPTCGAYSFTITKNRIIISVGGDYLKPDEPSNTCRISKDGGLTWFSPKINPNGYRSNVSEIDGILYCCGTNGIDFSKNKGKTWSSFVKGNYFTLCEFDGKLAASTTKGRIHLFNLK
jgi:hypothetical protein